VNAILVLQLGAILAILTSTVWPNFSIERLPEETRRIIGSTDPLRIGTDGYLRRFNPVESVWEESPLVVRGPADLETAELNESASWVVVLQTANDTSADDLYRYSHFAVSTAGVSQTKEPEVSGSPAVIWQLPLVDWDSYKQHGQPFVYSATTVSRDPRFRGIGTSLAEIYETGISIRRRAIIVKVDEQFQEESLGNLVEVLWALRRYDISAWQIFDNREIYGNNRDPSRDLGLATAAKIRFYLGLIALERGSEADKQLYFGSFLGPDGDRQAAVENYFSAIREYLSRILTPKEIQDWEAETGYFLLMDAFFGRETPVAENFAYPIPTAVQTYGGYRHLENQQDRETGERIDRYHIGEDFNVGGGNEDLGFPVVAIGTGEVLYAGRVGTGLGNIVVLRHRLPEGSEVCSRSAHLNEIDVVRGQTVEIGDVIGTVGKSGNESDPNFYAHLHLDLAYSETCDKFLRDTPWYYPEESRETIDRFFLDVRGFISERLEASIETTDREMQ